MLQCNRTVSHDGFSSTFSYLALLTFLSLYCEVFTRKLPSGACDSATSMSANGLSQAQYITVTDGRVKRWHDMSWNVILNFLGLKKIQSVTFDHFSVKYVQRHRFKSVSY